MVRFRRKREQQEAPPEPEPQDWEEDVDEQARMSILEHLNELRIRVFRALLALVVGTIVGVVFASPVLAYLLEPYAALYPEGRQLVVLGPTGSVVSYFRVALLVGGIIAIPVITYQVLRFVLPGLTRKEKRYLLGSIFPITILFLVGVAFAWFVLMPPAISFLEGFQTDIFDPEWTADQYLSFVTSLLFWMGVAFETPLVFFVLSLLGFVTPGMLVKNWRIAIVGAAIAAAFITPTIDPVNMFLVMGPLLALYIISIFLVMIGRRMTNVSS